MKKSFNLNYKLDRLDSFILSVATSRAMKSKDGSGRTLESSWGQFIIYSLSLLLTATFLIGIGHAAAGGGLPYPPPAPVPVPVPTPVLVPVPVPTPLPPCVWSLVPPYYLVTPFCTPRPRYPVLEHHHPWHKHHHEG